MLLFGARENFSMDGFALLDQCAPLVATSLMRALVHVESSWRPFAIGMDAGAAPVSQPDTLTQAVAQAKALVKTGRRFSVGLAQIHARNVARFGMSWEDAFDPCTNLRAGQEILRGFYGHARAAGYTGDGAVRAALRGYNAGDIGRGVANGYASRVIGYAQGGAVARSRAADAQGTLASASPVSLQMTTSALRADRTEKSSTSEETLDIFEQKPAVQGF
ncbi:type IV secretion system protein VirB1 [Variovorax sp. OK212]|nr:type IV secretion system protein VirB1 [Variovorax sp. OK202]SFE52349.1 type IV secretion system protein VirB1 [Variovorax sp. OK212]